MYCNAVWRYSVEQSLEAEVMTLIYEQAGLEEKSCIFIVKPKTEELEILATEGLSMAYVNKSPILQILPGILICLFARVKE